MSSSHDTVRSILGAEELLKDLSDGHIQVDAVTQARASRLLWNFPSEAELRLRFLGAQAAHELRPPTGLELRPAPYAAIGDLTSDEATLLAAGEIILSIKAYRRRTSSGLREAKTVIDEARALLVERAKASGTPPRPSGGEVERKLHG